MALWVLSAATVQAAATAKGRGDWRLDGVARFPWSNLLTYLTPDHSVYNSTDEIHSKLRVLMTTCPELTLEPSAEDFRSSALNETMVLRLTSTSQSPTPRENVLLAFGIHGREYVASEVALALVYKLCDGSARSANVLERTTFIIFPVMNVAGRKKMGANLENGEDHTCASMRKNGADVDLNRNFDVSWDEGSTVPSAEDYRGPSPNSEPETQLLAGVAKRFTPKLFIDVHSGDETMMYPYSYIAQSCPKAAMQQALADHVGQTAFHCTNGAMNVATEAGKRAASLLDQEQLVACPKVGNAAESLDPPYLASGSTLDYMYEKLNTPFAYTWEVYTGVRYAAGAKSATASTAASASATATATAASSNAAAASSFSVHQLAAALESEPAHRAMDAVHWHPKAPRHVGMRTRSQQHVLLPGARASMPVGALRADMELDDCFAYFNPTNAADLARVKEVWSEALIAAAQELAKVH